MNNRFYKGFKDKNEKNLKIPVTRNKFGILSTDEIIKKKYEYRQYLKNKINSNTSLNNKQVDTFDIKKWQNRK